MGHPSDGDITALYQRLQEKDAELDEIIKKAKQAHTDIETKQNNVTSLESKITEIIDHANTVPSIKQSAEQSFSEINKFKENIYKKAEGQPSLDSQIQTAVHRANTLTKKINNIDTKISEVEKSLSEANNHKDIAEADAQKIEALHKTSKIQHEKVLSLH